MDTDTLLLERQPNGIRIVTINRPAQHNALDMRSMRLFADLIDGLAADDEARVIIVTGAGDAAFCSGGDLNDLSGRRSATDAAEMTALMGGALLALERLPVPVMAAINGYALGGGSEIALACDLRVVDARSRLGFVHLRRGLIPGWGGGQRLLRLVGYARAMELLLEARTLSADDLVSLRLVNRVVPEGAALAGALELAEQFAQADPAGVRAIKALLQAGLTRPYEDALEAERALFPDLWTGETHVRNLDAFVNKRARG